MKLPIYLFIQSCVHIEFHNEVDFNISAWSQICLWKWVDWPRHQGWYESSKFIGIHPGAVKCFWILYRKLVLRTDMLRKCTVWWLANLATITITLVHCWRQGKKNQYYTQTSYWLKRYRWLLMAQGSSSSQPNQVTNWSSGSLPRTSNAWNIVIAKATPETGETFPIWE